MPIYFGVGEAIELLDYGKFTLLSVYGEIDKTDAVKITATPEVATDPAVTAVYHIKRDWAVLTERFNWGSTSIPNKVYYELWAHPGLLVRPAWNVGFYCGSKIRESNIDNRCTHIFAGEKIEIKLWNCSDPAIDVTYDFTVWYFTYLIKYHDKVMAILLRTPDLLERVRDLLEARMAIETGRPIAEIKAKTVEEIVEEELAKRRR